MVKALMLPSTIWLFMNMPMVIEVTLATPTEDRSMPPVIMHSMPPRAMMPNSGNWLAMVVKLMTV